MRAPLATLAFAGVMLGMVPAAFSENAREEARGWSRAYGVGACVNCPSGTGVMAGEQVGQGLADAAAGMFGAVLAPFARAPVAPPPELFDQPPPQGMNCWVEAGAGQKGYWARCP
ncbi:hypothetical protein ACT6QG_01450 [Xanthobacter sp. TB0136]|uniref:hypothetical protein n=1 Tax=Xanthobacter sp. TB0136 TaxID=3459177 RepID=UPI00403935B1